MNSSVISLGVVNANMNSPAVAAGNGEFLATWIGADKTLWARRVRASDGARLDAADIAVAQRRHVFSQRVSRLGVVASNPPLPISNLHPSASGERSGIAAAAPGLFLVSYTNYTPLSKNRVKLRLVSDVHTQVTFPPGRRLPCCSATSLR